MNFARAGWARASFGRLGKSIAQEQPSEIGATALSD
jgi:hypothetical protein